MKRIIQPDLMRSHAAQVAAVFLWLMLSATLVVSLFRGIQQLGTAEKSPAMIAHRTVST